MEGIIDFHALEKELEEAIATDEKYQRENEAKFRAVHQKVASYEEFRDIVLASHLKPLEKRDKMGKKRKALWNSCTIKADCKQESEFIEVLTEKACTKDQDTVLEILESFPGTKCFGLNVELLSEQEKAGCRQLFEKLQRMETDTANPPEFSCASDEENAAVTQMDCQVNGLVERKLVKLMHLYHVC